MLEESVKKDCLLLVMSINKVNRIDSATTLFIQLVTNELLKEAEKNGIVRFDDYNMYAITIDIPNC